jgi:tripeptide aminopeptidase
MLAEELNTLNLANVQVDEHAIVTACLPQHDAPTIRLLAHMDTSPSVSGKHVQPLVHPDYQGLIQLPTGHVLEAADDPVLARVLGHTLVTSDGATLLGVDDKAGVAAIMEAVCILLRRPELPRCQLKLAFTPDEEIGRGIKLFNIDQFGAVAAYTADGGELGEMHGENFNALNLKITFQGRSAHTGSARGTMISALTMAATFALAIPAYARPETTAKREGFIHLDELSGTVEKVIAVVLLRDFTMEGLDKKAEFVRSFCSTLESAYPGSRVIVDEMRGYRNMKDSVEKDPRVLGHLQQAMLDAGIQPLVRAIRGGTDGAELSAHGLPTPNFFVGGGNFHSRAEWVSVQWMEKAAEVAVRLAGLWAS